MSTHDVISIVSNLTQTMMTHYEITHAKCLPVAANTNGNINGVQNLTLKISLIGTDDEVDSGASRVLVDGSALNTIVSNAGIFFKNTHDETRTEMSSIHSFRASSSQKEATAETQLSHHFNAGLIICCHSLCL